jgi:hypothetical protein
MKQSILIFLLLALLFTVANAQKKIRSNDYRGSVQREDGRLVVFDFKLIDSAGKRFAYIRNAGEKIRVDKVVVRGDSLFMEMPVFESQFKAAFSNDGTILGQWIKGTATAAGFQIYPFMAVPHRPRFEPGVAPKADLSGRWAVTLVRTDSSTRPAIAEFKQEGSRLTVP